MSCLQRGQFAFCSNQRSMHRQWKRCMQGTTLMISPTWQPWRQQEHSSPRLMILCVSFHLMMGNWSICSSVKPWFLAKTGLLSVRLLREESSQSALSLSSSDWSSSPISELWAQVYSEQSLMSSPSLGRSRSGRCTFMLMSMFMPTPSYDITSIVIEYSWLWRLRGWQYSVAYDDDDDYAYSGYDSDSSYIIFWFKSLSKGIDSILVPTTPKYQYPPHQNQ